VSEQLQLSVLRIAQSEKEATTDLRTRVVTEFPWITDVVDRGGAIKATLEEWLHAAHSPAISPLVHDTASSHGANHFVTEFTYNAHRFRG
jgi:hypothetical protein